MLHFRNPMRSEQREQSLGHPNKKKRAAPGTHSLPDTLAAQWNNRLATLTISNLKSQIPNKNPYLPVYFEIQKKSVPATHHGNACTSSVFRKK